MFRSEYAEPSELVCIRPLGQLLRTSSSTATVLSHRRSTPTANALRCEPPVTVPPLGARMPGLEMTTQGQHLVALPTPAPPQKKAGCVLRSGFVLVRLQCAARFVPPKRSVPVVQCPDCSVPPPDDVPQAVCFSHIVSDVRAACSRSPSQKECLPFYSSDLSSPPERLDLLKEGA